MVMDASSACTASVLLLSILSFLPSSRANLIDWKCDPSIPTLLPADSLTDYFAFNASGRYPLTAPPTTLPPTPASRSSIVRSLLSSLAANASRSLYPVGFATANLGGVWGLALCRGDIKATECQSCLAPAPDDAFGQCKNASSAAIYYDKCIVRYSIWEFVSQDNGQVERCGQDSFGNNVFSDAARFNKFLVSLMSSLSDWAAFNTTSKYATGVMYSDQGFVGAKDYSTHNINGLVQCTPDQAPGACRRCLKALIDQIPMIFVKGDIGGWIAGIWCNLKYEPDQFYDGSPILKLVGDRTPPPSTGSPPPSSVPTDQTGDRYLGHKQRIYIIAITLSIFLAFLLLGFVLGYKKCRSEKKSKETIKIESILHKNGTMHLKRYTYGQVKRMTKSFAEKLGQGGFGAVYRGNLSNGHDIAVKMLKDYKTDGEGFINEVASISRTSHVNVVTLIGFCLEGSRRALIYEYMPNGSLEKYAFKHKSKGDETTLSWEKLLDIAVGIARGLEYLHRGCNTRIVHFDIKPHNILLDKDFCPKISDFGLAKLCLNKESAISIGGARGTIGYIAPEVYSRQFGAVSSKSDVYSYGMMILEMVGARENMSTNSESSSQYFPQWIYERLDDYCANDSEINEETSQIVRKMIVVALWCIQLIATNRPTMTRVLEMLEGSTSVLELPPKSELLGA